MDLNIRYYNCSFSAFIVVDKVVKCECSLDRLKPGLVHSANCICIESMHYFSKKTAYYKTTVIRGLVMITDEKKTNVRCLLRNDRSYILLSFMMHWAVMLCEASNEDCGGVWT